MKKILITISILITSLFFVGNVNAAQTIADSIDVTKELRFIDFNEVNQNIYYGNNSTSINKKIELLVNKFNSQTEYDSYLIMTGVSSAQTRMYLFNKDNSLNFVYFNCNYMTTGFNYNLYFPTSMEKYYWVDGTDVRLTDDNITSNKINGITYKTAYATITYWSIYYDTYNGDNKLNNKAEYYELYYLSNRNIDIIYSTDYTNSPNYNTFYKNVYLNNNLLYSNGQSVLKPKVPSFGSMELKNYYTGNDIYSVLMKLPVNNYDADNYSYEYQKSTDSEWKDLKTSYVTEDKLFNKLFFENGSYFFRIVDKENNIISTTSMTLSNINETTSYLTFDISTPDFCTIKMKEKDYVTCKYLNIYAHNFVEHSKVGYYSYDNENWTIFYSNTNLVVSDNGVMYFKLVDINDNNNILSTYTFTIAGIDDNLPDIGNFGINFISNLSKNKTYTDLSIIFYNVNKKQRKYFYSTDFENWTEVTDLLVDNDKFSMKYILRLYANGTIAAKVEDYNGNVLKYSTITITSITYSPESLLDYVSDFVDSLKDYSDFFNRSFDLFFNGLPEMVRLFMVVVWIIFLYFFIMQLGGWK